MTTLRRDKEAMWKYYGIPSGMPTGLQAASIIGQLAAYKRKLDKDLDTHA